jgi:hypothetical protein
MVRYLIKHKRNIAILHQPHIKQFKIPSSDFAICPTLATDYISTDPLLHIIDLAGAPGIAVSINTRYFQITVADRQERNSDS